MGRGRRRKSRISDQRYVREAAKRMKRQAKMSKGKGKPAGTPSEKSLPQSSLGKKAGQKSDFVELKQLSFGWAPKFKPQGLAMLKKGETVNLGGYSFVPLKHFLEQGRLCVEAFYGFDLTSKKQKFFGIFEIDLEKKTIRKFREGEQWL